jgi:hypothetical protein
MKKPAGIGFALVCTAFTAACGPAQLPTPDPRPILVYSGERITADPVRMREIENWLVPELERIDLDPDFLIRIEEERRMSYPWDTVVIIADTAEVSLASAAPDAQSPYMIYGYLKLMESWGELPEVLADSVSQTPYEVERAIVSRVADVWLLGRSVYDTHPFGPLDELVFSKESGYLEDFILATQGERFTEEAVAYRAANPSRAGEYADWFRSTFMAEGPQFIRRPGDEPPDSVATAPAADAPAADAPDNP